jgi:hypothetical protein
MPPTAQSHTNSSRTILGLLLLVAFFSSVGHAQTPPVRTSPADSPFPDVAGAMDHDRRGKRPKVPHGHLAARGYRAVPCRGPAA